MGAFKLPVDIANRACQNLGAQRILTSDFSEDSQQAAELGACYDALRESELRRNLWVFSTKRMIARPIDLTSTLWTPPTYAAASTYSVGETVQDTAGEWWQSKVNSNIGNTPVESSAFWRRYCGQDAPVLFDTTLKTTYYAGEIVLLPVTWSGATTYGLYDVVKVANATYYDTYISLQASNLNQAPATATTYWQLLSTWMAQTNPQQTNPVNYPTGYTLYLALASGMGGNVANVPGAGNWRTLAGTVSSLQILYPIGTGPALDNQTGNVYRLPRGYLRHAPENPKGSANTYLGAPHLAYRTGDIFEDNYIIATLVGPRMIRYVGDLVDVPDFDPMFCEGLAARMSLATCDRITGSNTDRQEQIRIYKEVMGEAREANIIELGAMDTAEDEFITCRL